MSYDRLTDMPSGNGTASTKTVTCETCGTIATTKYISVAIAHADKHQDETGHTARINGKRRERTAA